MRKIMFSDEYGLTKAVLEGRKTMTRRIVKEMAGREYKKLPQIQEDCNDGSFLVFKDADDLEPIILYPKYKVGEVVAVAQAYKDTCWTSPVLKLKDKPGWSNKIFVYAGLMPHQIRITAVRVERLQSISDEDCKKEGLEFRAGWNYHSHRGAFDTPRDAFAALIDKMFGKGTWASNPWVYVYEFELVK